MAVKKETITRIYDDYDGDELGPGDHVKVSFTYEGQRYDLDLSKANAKTFKDFIKPYTKNPTGKASSQAGTRMGILKWAKDQGLVAPTHRGRLPQTVLDAYDAAH